MAFMSKSQKSKAVTIPPMDGAFKPNDQLERARLLCRIDGPDNLVLTPSGIRLSSGSRLLALNDESLTTQLCAFPHAIVAMDNDDAGGLWVALDQGALLRVDTEGKTLSETHTGSDCITAIAAAPDGALYLTVGSRKNSRADWKRDLLQRQAAGEVLQIAGNGTPVVLASGLAFPNGLVVQPDGALVISESWKHQLVEIRGETSTVRLQDLPGYPARIARATDEGYWLALFAPRNQLVEFLFGENEFCEEMMRSVEPRFWLAPTLERQADFRAPQLLGGSKLNGSIAPWSPSLSSGLIVRLSDQFVPVSSYHSRANGHVHGITSCVEASPGLIFNSFGANEVRSLGLKSEAGNA